MLIRIIITLSFYLTTAVVLNNAFAAEAAGATTTVTEDGRQIPDPKSVDTHMTPQNDGFVGPKGIDEGRQPASVDDEEEEDFYENEENDLNESDWEQEDDLMSPPSPTRNGI